MLYDEITQLIATHREDDWWDFKEVHHHDKAVNDKINSNNSAECTIVAVFFFTINEKNKKNCTDNIIYY